MTIAYSGFTGLSGKAGADFLESSRIVTMMLYLYSNGETRKSELYKAVGRGNRMPDKLESLRDLGLIYFRGDNEVRPIIGLTSLGFQVASHLQDIDNVIRSSAEQGVGSMAAPQ